MSSGRFVNIEEVIEVYSNETGDDWLADSPAMEDWIKYAIKRINSKRSFKFSYDVEDIVDNGYIINLCPDTYEVIGLLPGDRKEDLMNVFARYESGDCLGTGKLVDVKSPEFGAGLMVVTPSGLNVSHSEIKWKVVDKQLVFHYPLNYEKATIYKRKFKRDKRGKLMVLETDVLACAVYCCLMRARRSRWGKPEQRMSRGDIQDYETRFAIELGDARAKGSKLSASREEEAHDMMRSTIIYNYTNPE